MTAEVTGKVAKIISDRKLVINKGSLDGITISNEFLIYFNDEEIFDPDTKESLGYLEILCGIGKVNHMQERITTIIPAREIVRDVPNISFLGASGSRKECVVIPFKHIEEEKKLLFKTIK